MLRTAICDDNEIHLKKIAEDFSECCQAYSPEISLFSSGQELIDAVEKKEYQPDILLLDIVLNDDSGISVAKRINSLCPGCGIIFLTSFLAYASDVYETRHSYFILKSQFKERIRSAVAKAISDVGSRKYLSFAERNNTLILPAYQVLYLERSLKKTIIYHETGKQYETYEKPLVILKDMNNNLFVQCHQSFFVNMERVNAMYADYFIMSNGCHVPISRSRRRETKELFHAFVSNSIKDNIVEAF